MIERVTNRFRDMQNFNGRFVFFNRFYKKGENFGRKLYTKGIFDGNIFNLTVE